MSSGSIFTGSSAAYRRWEVFPGNFFPGIGDSWSHGGERAGRRLLPILASTAAPTWIQWLIHTQVRKMHRLQDLGVEEPQREGLDNEIPFPASITGLHSGMNEE